jgi:YjbE family integral membrane protein
MDQSSQILQIIFADIILSGDNALVIGMSAANLPDNIRKKAILIGMGLAAFFRIFFAAIASFLLAIPGILFFGGCLLLWVCWRFYLNIKTHQEVVSTTQEETVEDGISDYKKLLSALTVIAIADVSMSIDNVIAVAAIAREDTKLLIFGLILAIAFMALFSTMFMRLMIKYSFLSWLGLIFLIYLSVKMLYDGIPEIIHLVWG